MCIKCRKSKFKTVSLKQLQVTRHHRGLPQGLGHNYTICILYHNYTINYTITISGPKLDIVVNIVIQPLHLLKLQPEHTCGWCCVQLAKGTSGMCMPCHWLVVAIGGAQQPRVATLTQKGADWPHTRPPKWPTQAPAPWPPAPSCGPEPLGACNYSGPL